MIMTTLPVWPLQVNCYILGCEETRQAVIIDPGDNPPAILAALKRHDLTASRILLTHAHFDHLLAARAVHEATRAPISLHPADLPFVEQMRQTTLAWLGRDPGEPPRIEGSLAQGETLTLGEISLEVRHTPGHSPGGVTLVDHAGRRAFVGDALFAGSIGRVDLPGGSPAQLLHSIREQILTLPDEYAVLSGHGPATTVGEERRSNPYLTGDLDDWQ